MTNKLIEEFRQKWEGANTHDMSICTPVINEMIDDITTLLTKQLTELEEWVEEQNDTGTTYPPMLNKKNFLTLIAEQKELLGKK